MTNLVQTVFEKMKQEAQKVIDKVIGQIKEGLPQLYSFDERFATSCHEKA